MIGSTIAALTLLSAALGSPGTADGSTPTAPSPPSVGGAPVEVAIGFYALDFARITSREESFDLTGYLEMSWRDPAIPPAEALGPGRKGSRRLDPGRIWMPRILFENALEQPRFHNTQEVEIDESGLITAWSIVSDKFSVPMDLRRFPFDRQTLPVRIGSFDDVAHVRFSAKPELAIIDPAAFVTDWNILRAESRVVTKTYVPGQDEYPRFEYRVEVARRWTFYAWRVMLPLTLLALVSWAVFWFEPVGLQPQISTCMAALIALVAFNFAIDFSLPKVAYLTLIDKHALVGFSFVVLAVVAVAAIHVRVTQGRVPSALRIQRFCRIGFVPAYLLALYLSLTL